MLRAVSSICIERQAELLANIKRDFSKLLKAGVQTTACISDQTVLVNDGSPSRAADRGGAPPPAPEPSPPPPRPPRSRSAWTLAAAATATASLGGMYMYRKLKEEKRVAEEEAVEAGVTPASALPERVQYLVAGAGTAAFAALRTLRAARPEAAVLLVGEERALPYMRPPLSKELWREPGLAARATDPERLAFSQWNGRRRSVMYEPSAFYTPVERLQEGEGGAAVARGWRVERLDVTAHRAELRAPGQPPRTVLYDKCLVATGSRPRRVAVLREAAAAGRSLALRSLEDVSRLAAALDEPRVRTVAIVGGGFLACELGAALAHTLRERDAHVVQVFREESPLAGVLPAYLAADAARRLRAAGVRLRPAADLLRADLEEDGGVRLRLADGGELRADLVVECVGCEPDAALPAASQLETHPQLGGVLVNAELQARTDVYAAGDAACFYDVALGRRRVEHHDHAVVSGRLAGTNMAALTPPHHYTHQSMFWSDLGPDFGYEAIGVVEAQLPTMGVFCADGVREVEEEVGGEAGEAGAAARRSYDRGVVFYLREERVVGVLLWNLFNRMHVARQVLAQGKFEDLFEVAKLFKLHEDEQLAEEGA